MPCVDGLKSALVGLGQVYWLKGSEFRELAEDVGRQLAATGWTGVDRAMVRGEECYYLDLDQPSQVGEQMLFYGVAYAEDGEVVAFGNFDWPQELELLEFGNPIRV
jgi:hypothetical protein